MDLPKFVALVGDRELTDTEEKILYYIGEPPPKVTAIDRPKILLVGDGPFHSRILQTLLDLDFADVEMRCLNDLVVHGRGFNRVIVDELDGIRSENIPIRDVYNWKPEPADSIERRKEPKGPRGRWGKL